MSERSRIIPAERSIIVAADVEPTRFPEIVDGAVGVEGVGAIKIGFEVAFNGLQRAVEWVRDRDMQFPVIYDHQKAGNDIPETGKNFARAMGLAHVNAAIIFPFTGPKTQEYWTKALQQQGIGVIVGAEMTHEGFRQSEGGRIADETLYVMFQEAIDQGVRDFVVPGNKPDAVRSYQQFFERQLGGGNFDLYAPGFVAQGGNISEAGKVAGQNWHAIVGRGITEADNPRAAAMEYASQL